MYVSLPHIVLGHVTDLLASDISTTSLTVTWNPPTLYRDAITMYKVCAHVCTYVPKIIHNYVYNNYGKLQLMQTACYALNLYDTMTSSPFGTVD